MTGALNGNRQFTLMMRTGASYSAGKNLCPFRDKAAQFRNIFIINRIYFINTKAADLPAAFASARSTVSVRSFRPVISVISHKIFSFL